MLEYIEATGTQYIDTEVQPSDDLEIEISFQPTSSVQEGAIFGADWSTNGYFMMYYSGKWRFHTRGYVFDSSSAVDTSTFTIIKTTTNSITINGSMSTWTKGSTTDASNNILVLYANGTYTAKKYGYGRIAYMKMWKGGTLVRDFIPALRSDGIAGLYDKVNDTFYASAGSSNFVASSESAEIIATQTSVTGTYKIPFGTAYTVKASDVASYFTPSLYGKTADSKTNVVTMQYVYNTDPGITTPTNGVWIQSTDGKYYTSENWLSNKTPNGIAVVTSQTNFVIGLVGNHQGYAYVDEYDPTTVPDGYVGYSTEAKAILSFNSKSETEVMVEWFGDETDTPQGYATNYYFPNGKRGFLPSAGVAQTIADNFSSIHNAFDKLEIHFYAYYLALSTFEAIGTGNAFVWHLYMLDENSISLGTRDVTNGSYLDVYPITDLS